MSDFEIPSAAEGRQLAKQPFLDGQGLKQLIYASLTWLRTNQQMVNALNVFPVPDGDTGTNMVLTLQAAFTEIASSGENNVGKIAHAIAQGALMGARGNSGVILSQLFRGFARSLDNFEKIDSTQLVRAFGEARNTAYKGVVRPVEGTILTVAKDVAQTAEVVLASNQDMNNLLERIVEAAEESVRRTPDLLPILKQAGVVDSGGKGLFFILEGMLRFINGQSLDTALATIQPLAAMKEEIMESVEPGQEYEVVVDFRPHQPIDLEKFYSDLSEIGTSIQVGEGEGMYRMHIHVAAEKRYDPIDYTMSIGTITKVMMENLVAQMDEGRAKGAQSKLQLLPVEPDQIAVVAVSPGFGISRIFASLGVSAIVAGGQTMNPSTEEILHAFENLPTDKIVILPNNKNIILAAQTASTMTVKHVKVIPTKSVPQGLSAMLRLIPRAELNHVAEDMTNAINDVDSGEITVATRSIELNGIQVQQGEVIALLNGQLILSTDSIEKACLGLLQKAQTADRERITLFYGENISRNEVNAIVDQIRSNYPSHEIELHEGGQPHYYFIIAIE